MVYDIRTLNGFVDLSPMYDNTFISLVIKDIMSSEEARQPKSCKQRSCLEKILTLMTAQIKYVENLPCVQSGSSVCSVGLIRHAKTCLCLAFFAENLLSHSQIDESIHESCNYYPENPDC